MILIVCSLLASLSFADEPAMPAPSPVPITPTHQGRVHREKEADGTEAINRFKTDAVVKSQYKLGGQSLEVDPD